MNRQILTDEQKLIRAQFIAAHGLDADQISFEGDSNEPILDYESLNMLRLKLTNIESIDTSYISRDYDMGYASCEATGNLPDGRNSRITESAEIGEPMPDGGKLETMRQAVNVAQARALRRLIRALGINILKAHQEYIQKGNTSEGVPVDPRIARTKEIHALAAEIGYINGTDKSDYQNHIAAMFDGRTSSKDLDDLELSKLTTSLRALRRLQVATLNAKQKLAA